MKKTSIIVVPVIIVILLLAGALVWKMMMPAATSAPVEQGTLPSAVNEASGKVPSNPFSGLFGQTPPQVTVMPTPTPASVASMNSDLNSVGDDGGASDISNLQSQVNGL